MNKQHKIAKFLGASMVPHADKGHSLNPMMYKWSSPKFEPLDGKFLSGHELKFDSDWNWLMVIANDITATDDFKYDYEGKEYFWDVFCQFDINAVYQEVIDFLEWLESK